MHIRWREGEDLRISGALGSTAHGILLRVLLALVMEIGEGNETMSKGSNFRIDCPWNPEEDFFELFSISY